MTPTDRPTLERYEKLIFSHCRREEPPMGKLSPVKYRFPVRSAFWWYASVSMVARKKAVPEPVEPAPAPPPVGPLPAGDGSRICMAVLDALGWYVLSRRVDEPLTKRTATSDATFSRLIDSQLDSGEFLLASHADNPEPHWYHELVLLHTMAVFALNSGRADAWRAVERAAAFHLNETQPDHATTEPWAIYAFVHFFDTLPLADYMLHAVQVQHPKGPPQFPWLLLRDALYCVRKELAASG